MIRGAVFDVDGTLLDSMGMWDTLGEDYLRMLGYEPEKGLNEIFRKFSLYQAACYYRSRYGVTLSVDEIMSGVNKRIEAYYMEEVTIKPGTEEFLRRLKERKVKMCIATANDRHLVEAALVRCRIRDCFSQIFTCTSVGCGKDEPVIYREAQKCLGVPKEETVVFEDALYAAETAKKDGFLIAAVYDGYEKQQTKMQALADFYFRDLSDTVMWEKFAREL